MLKGSHHGIMIIMMGSHSASLAGEGGAVGRVERVEQKDWNVLILGSDVWVFVVLPAPLYHRHVVTEVEKET